MASLARNRRIVLATVVAASALLLTGCSAIGNTPTGTFQGIPDGVEVDNDTLGVPVASWQQYGQKIAITTFGSSTCPLVGTSINVVKSADEGNEVRVDIADLPDRPCTMDLVPFTTEFWTPENVTTTQPLKIEVLDQTIELGVKAYEPVEESDH